MQNKIIPIVYMVAGISSRFQGKIKQFAKVTENETLIEYSINQALKAGFNKIIFIVGNLTEKPFKEKFKESYKGIPINYALQKYNPEERDKPWGTGDALCSAIEILKEPFVVCNGDDIYGEETFKKLFDHLQKNTDNAVIGYKLIDVLPQTGKGNRAIFKIENNFVKSIKEIPNIERTNLKELGLDQNDLCSMNIYALQKTTLDLINKKLLEFKQKHKGDRKIECLIQDRINELLEERKITLQIYPGNGADWLGVTCPEDEEIVRNKIKKIILIKF